MQAVVRSFNPGHNIWELHNISVQLRFTTSKTKLYIQYSKLGIQVASRVAERLETYPHGIFTDGGGPCPHKKKGLGSQEIRKYQKNLKFEWRQRLAPSLSTRKLTLATAVKNQAKIDIKLFFPVQYYWISLFCSKYFVRDCGCSMTMTAEHRRNADQNTRTGQTRHQKTHEVFTCSKIAQQRKRNVPKTFFDVIVLILNRKTPATNSKQTTNNLLFFKPSGL